MEKVTFSGRHFIKTTVVFFQLTCVLQKKDKKSAWGKFPDPFPIYPPVLSVIHNKAFEKGGLFPDVIKLTPQRDFFTALLAPAIRERMPRLF